MANKSTGKHYVSKGERPSVSRKTLNAVRQEKKKSFQHKSWHDSFKARNYVMSRKGDKSSVCSLPNAPSYNDLRERYIEEDRINSVAKDLFERYKSAGVTWAACVQAVKTDYVSTFQNKYGNTGKTSQNDA